MEVGIGITMRQEAISSHPNRLEQVGGARRRALKRLHSSTQIQARFNTLFLGGGGPLVRLHYPLCLLSRDLLHCFIPGFIKRLGMAEEGHQLAGQSFTLRNLRNYLK